MELEFDDCRALNGFRFNMLNTGNVEEMIFVVIGQVPFHLGRVHSAVRLRDVNRRNAECGKNVLGHLLPREHGNQRHSDHYHDDCERTAQCKFRKIHWATPFGSNDTPSRWLFFCTRAKMAGRTNNVAMVAAARPPITARPSGTICLSASPSPIATGNIPAIIARLVIKMGRRRLRAPSLAASAAVAPLTRVRSAKVTNKMALA